MTAIIGILNTKAAILAADSAITVGDRTYNTGNKLFLISNNSPIGVMLFNNANFMYTPWETIIKMYREETYNKIFQSVKDCQNDFVVFFNRNIDIFTNNDIIQEYFKSSFKDYIEYFSVHIINEIKETINNTKISNEEFKRLFILKFTEKIMENDDKIELCHEIEESHEIIFTGFIETIFRMVYKEYFIDNEIIIPEDVQEEIKHKFYYEMFGAKENSFSSGLVFVGFGKNEIYPSLIPIIIKGCFKKKIIYFVDKERESHISWDMPSSICPFAMTDVINTILKGVSPKIYEAYLGIVEAYHKKLIGEFPEIENKIDANKFMCDTIVKYKETLDEIISANFVIPIMKTVSSLSKEDLAEMAESLIYLTYLNRRITSSQECVGGPIDVAIISKGDGFVWIKRKHYFRSELNPVYFNKLRRN